MHFLFVATIGGRECHSLRGATGQPWPLLFWLTLHPLVIPLFLDTESISVFWDPSIACQQGHSHLNEYIPSANWYQPHILLILLEV